MFGKVTNRPAPWPHPFMWGTATSAYQIEGGGSNTDWWRFERSGASGVVASCDDACDSWRRYEEDLDLVESLGLNAYRFSVEWARIEPRPGEFSSSALAHYAKLLASCRRRQIVPVVTLHHFTLPLWVADAGGFEHPAIATWMANYARVVGDALGRDIGIACTINEPNIVAVMGYLAARFPPQVASWDRFVAVNRAMRACHVAMRSALRRGDHRFPIGMALSMQQYEALPGGDALLNSLRHEMEDEYLSATDGDDFLGVQCYTKILVGPDGIDEHPDGELTQMGYLFWPECVEYTVRRAAQFTALPIMVTENGIGTEDDDQRIRYLDRALRGLRAARQAGVDVRGYFQWSLLDNFEWTFGYEPKFGLVAVDRTTFQRTPKPSAQWYGDATRRLGFDAP